MPRSVFWLAAALALFTTGNALVLSVAVLVGSQLSADPAYATVPLLAQYIGLILTSVPMAHFMMQFGRRSGFILGNMGGLAGALFAIIGVYTQSLLLFSIGTFFTGIAIGTAQQYRFVALEETPISLRSKAIGLTMSGGIIAVLIGPSLAVSTRTIIANYPFMGTFGALSIIYILAFILLLFLPLKPHQVQIKTEYTLVHRSYLQLYSQPLLRLIAVVSAMGYALVVYMVGTFPLAMKAQGFDFAAITFVFQCHILGMFAPSFFTGQLISCFGVKTFVWLGAMCLVIANIIGFTGSSYAHFLFTMTLVGLAWNFILISTTHLLPKTYHEHERAKVQGATDFLIFGFGSFGSLIAGFAFYFMGWDFVNIMGLAIGVGIIIAMGLLRNSLNEKSFS
ncbi:MFS transporter [Providencia alcalifaciens]|uniref:Transporter, major facilitator family protein n=1 Tax=Providencia alcalifaciens 205/92 TaxID=1256988 RepID=A0AAV3M125_9GAMM|nr:MFS transporter [Providencia alcalifaciens]EUD09443.1 transporter, major facilitator family protein [Providencia alcalifaciens 205/92]WGZ53907.1 MFS transporter [Providencia alcalifaciens]